MNSQSVLDSRYSWTRLAICVLISAIGSVGMWAVVLVIPAMQADFGVSRADVSLFYTTTMIGFGVGNLLVGRFVDRFGLSRALILSALAIGTGFYLVSLSSSVWQIAILQGALIGVGTSTSFGPLIADISHWFMRRRGIAVALAASGNYLAGAIWPLILKDIVASGDWRGAYVLVAVICSLTIIPLALLLRRQPTEQQLGATVPRRQTMPRRTELSPRALQKLLIIAGVACCVAMSMPQVHIVALAVDLGFGVAAGAQMLSLMVAGGVVSRLLSGLLADHIGGVKTLLIGSILQTMALFLFIPVDGLMPLYAVSLIFGLAQGGIVPAYAMIVREYLPAREAGQTIGLIMMATIFGMALGGWLSGLIYDLTGSYLMAFVNGIAWNVLNIGIMMLILWRTGTRRMVPA
jgi:MFS family permease